MNDNVYAEGPHHAECLRLLNDLHDLLVWAEAMGLKMEKLFFIAMAAFVVFPIVSCFVALPLGAITALGAPVPFNSVLFIAALVTPFIGRAAYEGAE